MIFHFVLGAATFLAGLILVLVGTDYGRIINVTVGVIAGSALVLLGAARLKYAWLNRHQGLD